MRALLDATATAGATDVFVGLGELPSTVQPSLASKSGIVGANSSAPVSTSSYSMAPDSPAGQPLATAAWQAICSAATAAPRMGATPPRLWLQGPWTDGGAGSLEALHDACHEIGKWRVVDRASAFAASPLVADEVGLAATRDVDARADLAALLRAWNHGATAAFAAAQRDAVNTADSLDNAGESGPGFALDGGSNRQDAPSPPQDDRVSETVEEGWRGEAPAGKQVEPSGSANQGGQADPAGHADAMPAPPRPRRKQDGAVSESEASLQWHPAL